MNNPLSLDPWGGTDIVNGAALAVFNGSVFENAAAGLVIHGTYGNLTLTDATGDYIYTPTDASSVGHTDTFTYALTANGHTDTATLTVSTDSIAAEATHVHTLADTGVNYTAAIGDQVIIGGAGNDTITGNDTSHHLEGGAGNDHLVGGIGNDFLIGGDVYDILEGAAGHNQYILGPANDTIIIDNGATDLTDSPGAPRHIDGGSGYDTLDLSHLASADLSGANHTGISSIEAISLSGGSGTAVTLDAQSVLDISSNHELVITGDNNDKVNLNGSAGTWTAGETGLTVAGDTTHTYDAYNASVGGSHVTVLVEHETNVQVQLNHS
jgi:hypothetical protein